MIVRITDIADKITFKNFVVIHYSLNSASYSKMSTPPPRKSTKRNNANVEKSPDIKQKLEDTYKELKSLIDSKYETYSHAKNEEIIRLLDEHLSRVSELVKNEVLKIHEEFLKLKNKNSEDTKSLNDVNSSHADLSMRLNQLEQEKLVNRIEISGLNPSILNSQKPAFDIASQVLKVYGISNFEYAYKRQIRTESGQKSLLIVSFGSYSEKMLALNKKRTIDKGKNCTVFFNHTLTRFNRNLYMEARKLSKSINMTTIISHGRIFIRGLNEKFGTRIMSQSDLNSIRPQRQENL